MAVVARESGSARFRYLLDRVEVLGPVFMAPAILYMVAFLGLPFLLAIYFSLTDITINNIQTGFSFVGLENFIGLFRDRIFRQALRNTLIFAIASQLLAMILGQVTALILMQDFRGKTIVRVAILLPWAVPIALGVLGWKWMFDSLYSIINWTLQAFHILGPDQWPQWLGTSNLAMISVIVVHAWKAFPFVAVIFLGAMTAIPQDIIDAARVDGAGFWRRTFQVNVPIIAPIVSVGVIFGTVFAFTDMSVVWLLTKGGPVNSTQVLGSYAFQVGIVSGDIGQGAATSLFLVPILMVAMVLTLRAMRRREL
ncbi:MAG: sugar ABC transporter permease [Anaerolineae bacterium]|nr:sugar ABC transporter permease [Anaerolineae bacterium]